MSREKRSDYLRACDGNYFIGSLICGPSQVLVLGDEAFPSKLVVMNDQIAIVRWIACPSSEKMEEIIHSRVFSEEGKIEQSPVEILLADEVCLFDSATDQSESASDSIESERIHSGSYFVSTELFEEKRLYQILVHRFKIVDTLIP